MFLIPRHADGSQHRHQVLIDLRRQKEKKGKRVSLDEYYGRLSLPGTASQAEVKRAYRRLRAKYHPDRNKGREAAVEPVFKRIQEAFEILTGKRALPDPNPAGASTAPRSKQDRPGGYPSERAMHGANCLIELFVPLEIAIHGGEVLTSFPLKDRRRKSVTVRVPPGVWDGQRLVVEGGGHPGPNGGSPGDAICSVTIVCEAAFRRDGLNIACEIPVDFVTATLGGSFEAQILGRAHPLAVPPNTQPGSKIRLAGQGLTDRNGARGDLTLHLVLAMPAAASWLTDDERQRLRDIFADAERRRISRPRS
jgi:molecular chaperone DnaJ